VKDGGYQLIDMAMMRRASCPEDRGVQHPDLRTGAFDERQAHQRSCRRMIADMTVRSFSDRTRRDYIRHVETFASFLGRSPNTATGDDLRIICRGLCFE
jgi:hypothetical protein